MTKDCTECGAKLHAMNTGVKCGRCSGANRNSFRPIPRETGLNKGKTYAEYLKVAGMTMPKPFKVS